MRVAIFGARGGIGGALVDALLSDAEVETVYGIARTAPEPISDPRFVPLEADLTDEAKLAEIAGTLSDAGPLDMVIVATGLLSDGEGLQPEKSWRDQSLGAFERIFAANTFGPALVAKHMLPLLNRKTASRFAVLSARVGSIADNRLGGWHAYRASKAALNMLVRNYALELARRNERAVCVSLHPGTVATDLSAPFTGRGGRKLFSPEDAARALLGVLSSLGPEDSGKHFDWSGREVPA